MRLTIRLKITLLIAAGFALLAGVLVATSYAFVANATTPQAQAAERSAAFRDALKAAGVDVPDLPQGPGSQQGPGSDTTGPGGRPSDSISAAFAAIEEQARQNVLSDLLTRSLLAFVIVAVVAIPVAYWLAGRILRPVDEISRAANELSEQTLSQRLPNEGPDDEFGRLRTAFNEMLARLESAFESRQRFAADASHELRTPLAVLEASADNVLESARPAKQAAELAAEVRTQVRRADSLISSLLALARADDVSRTREMTDLADLAAQALAEVADAAAAAGIEVEANLEDAPVLGDPLLLERLIANLLDNAILYNLPSGGTVELRVHAVAEASLVEVINSGPVLDPGKVPTLFERFQRGDRSESGGHGLGLPIVRKVAEAHGGVATAIARDGGGLDVRVEIPLARYAQQAR